MIAAHRCFRSKPQRALVNVTMTEMANQIKVGGVYHSQMHCISSDANYLNFVFLKYGHFERENCKCNICMPVRAVCKPLSPDLKKRCSRDCR